MNITCPECNKTFASQYSLIRHSKAKIRCVDRKKLYICELCKYKTKDKAKYTRHIKCKKNCTDINTLQIQNIIDELVEPQIKKYTDKIDKLEKKLETRKAPINYNFIVNNFTNALNIEDCMNTNNITRDIIDICHNKNMKDGAVYIFDKLCNLDPTKRPIHCTDASRLMFVVKTDDDWLIDANAEKIKNHMTPIVISVYNTVHGEKLHTENRTINEKLAHMDIMSKELHSSNVNKSCIDAIKKTTSDYLVKNIVSDNISENMCIDYNLNDNICNEFVNQDIDINN